jgi:hypothetical protein
MTEYSGFRKLFCLLHAANEITQHMHSREGLSFFLKVPDPTKSMSLFIYLVPLDEYP